jgi:hypothetical protein
MPDGTVTSPLPLQGQAHTMPYNLAAPDNSFQSGGSMGGLSRNDGMGGGPFINSIPTTPIYY